MNNIIRVIGMVVLTGLALALFVTVPAWFVWNWLVTDIFSLRTVSLVEMFCLIILTNILFVNNTSKSK